MEEEQTVQKHITVIEAAITFKDGTVFHASPSLLVKMTERVKREENRIGLPQEMLDGVYDIQWIEE